MSDVRSNAELTEAAASSLRWITVARISTEVLLLGSMILLARLMPPSAFGMFAVVLIFQEMAVTVPGEGIGSALVQRDSVRREHLQGGLALSLLVAGALAAITVLLAVTVFPSLFGDETASLVLLATPCFLLGGVVALPMAVLRRRLDFRRISMIELAQSAVRSLGCVFFAAVLALDAPALVLGGIAAMATTMLLALAFAPVPLPRWRGQAIRDLLPYGGPAALACLSWTGFRNGDYAIIGARLGATQAGFYWRGFQLAVEYQRKISTVMTQVAFPMLARAAGTKERFELRRRMVRLLTVTLFPLLVTLILVAPILVPWLFGAAWEPAVLPTQILAGAGAATVVIDAVGSVLMAEGRTRALLGYGVAHFAVYAAAVLVASTYGLTAVCVAGVGVHGAFLVVAYAVLLRGRGEPVLRFIWDDVAAGTVGAAALVAVAAPVDWATGQAGAHAVPHMLAVAASGGIAYATVLRLGFPEAWRDLAGMARRILPSRPVRSAARWKWTRRAGVDPA